MIVWIVELFLQPMYLTEVTISLISSMLIQIVLIPAQVIGYISRKSDPTRKRFLLLSLLFLAFNLLWVCSDLVLNSHAYACNQFLKILGLFVAGAVYSYIQKETRVSITHFSTFNLIKGVTIIYLLDFTLYQISIDILASYHKWIIAILLELIIAFFSSTILVRLLKVKHSQSPISTSSMIVCSLAFLTPIIYVLIEIEIIRTLFTNLIYFILAGAYLKQHVRQLQLETKLIKYNSMLFSGSLIERTKMEVLVKHKVVLTKRQIDVIILLLQNYDHQQVAERLYISYEAARKHASNIYKKFGVKNTAELIQVSEYTDYAS